MEKKNLHSYLFIWGIDKWAIVVLLQHRLLAFVVSRKAFCAAIKGRNHSRERERERERAQVAHSHELWSTHHTQTHIYTLTQDTNTQKNFISGSAEVCTLRKTDMNMTLTTPFQDFTSQMHI